MQIWNLVMRAKYLILHTEVKLLILSTKSHFRNLNFHKIHKVEILFLTKFQFFRSNQKFVYFQRFDEIFPSIFPFFKNF